jgi:hypothetical protein
MNSAVGFSRKLRPNSNVTPLPWATLIETSPSTQSNDQNTLRKYFAQNCSILSYRRIADLLGVAWRAAAMKYWESELHTPKPKVKSL